VSPSVVPGNEFTNGGGGLNIAPTSAPVAQRFNPRLTSHRPDFLDVSPECDDYVHERQQGEKRVMIMNVVKIRSRLADTINRVAYQGERVVLERRGKGVAALVSMEDLALLEKLEDEADAKAAAKALADMKRKKQKPIPWDQVKAELEL
jgi:prevent-host-death family protein